MHKILKVSTVIGMTIASWNYWNDVSASEIEAQDSLTLTKETMTENHIQEIQFPFDDANSAEEVKNTEITENDSSKLALPTYFTRDELIRMHKDEVEKNKSLQDKIEQMTNDMESNKTEADKNNKALTETKQKLETTSSTLTKAQATNRQLQKKLTYSYGGMTFLVLAWIVQYIFG